MKLPWRLGSALREQCPPDHVQILEVAEEEHWAARVAPAPRATSQSWRKGLHILHEFFQDPRDVTKAFEFLIAVGQEDMERYFQVFLASPHGPRLLARKPSLADVIQDQAALARMPEGSLGRAFLVFLEKYGYQALSIHRLFRQTMTKWVAAHDLPPPDADRTWFHDRYMLSHDLQHVVTGYGTDELGEAALSAFTLGQHYGLGLSALTLGAVAGASAHVGATWTYYCYRAWQRGRRARPLFAAPWEDLLPLPLDVARALLGIEPIRRAHPAGIWARHLKPPLGGAPAYGAPPDSSR